MAVVPRNPSRSTLSSREYCFLLLRIAGAVVSDCFLTYGLVFPPLPHRSSQVMPAGLTATLLSRSGKWESSSASLLNYHFSSFVVGKITANSDTPTCLSGCKHTPSVAVGNSEPLDILCRANQELIR